MGDIPKKFKTVHSVADPPHRIDFATFNKIFYWLCKKKFRGELVLQFPGKDNMLQLLYIESTPQYIPITKVDDIENIINSDTEGEEE